MYRSKILGFLQLNKLLVRDTSFTTMMGFDYLFSPSPLLHRLRDGETQTHEWEMTEKDQMSL